MSAPAAFSFTTAPLKADPNSISPVAADWMSCGPLVVSPTHSNSTLS